MLLVILSILGLPMKITTHFPLDLPHIPLMPHHARDKIVRRIMNEQVGKNVVVEIEDEIFFATISEITQTKDGFTTVVDIPDDVSDVLAAEG